ncbi:MAG: class II fumarate hydratase [Candidatus Sulfobium sp.]|jgi:fumarate hydratase class II
MDYRTERDSLGEVRVPSEMLYGPQTQRAVENFPVSGIRFPREFINALGLIKEAAAQVNAELGLLDDGKASAIRRAAEEVSAGIWDGHFPVDIFQTGSGTSTNMNANEVIARRAMQLLQEQSSTVSIHPNDDVNKGQSSNDVIPSAIHISAYMQVKDLLLPSLGHLESTLKKRAEGCSAVIKTGRTHLMDALPVSLGQEIGGWAHQVKQASERIGSCLPRLAALALGGTAVGTGVNTHPEFGGRIASRVSEKTGIPFAEAENHFAAQASMDTAAELSGHLKSTASALMKISNDLRFMNSGPYAGFGEISLPALQPGSSIMPGKINPVICEAVMMASIQVMANDAAVTAGNAGGNFQLNVMLPLIAHNLLQSIMLLGNVSRLLADQAVSGFTVNTGKIAAAVERNPILVTSLAPLIGYDKAAEIAKKAYAEGRRIREVAAEMTDLSPGELDRLLDPKGMTGSEGQ